MNKILVAKNIRDIILNTKQPKDISIKELKEWKFPVGDTYHIHRSSEVMLGTYYKNEPIGIVNYFVDGKNIKIILIQGVKLGEEKPRYERPWTEPVMESLIFASTPFIKQGYELKFNESLVAEINGWKKTRMVFQEEIARLEKELSLKENNLLTSTHKNELKEEITEIKHNLEMSKRKVNHYNNMLGVYGTVRNMYFDEKKYTISLKKPRTTKIITKFEEHLKKTPELHKKFISKEVKRKPRIRGIRL
ncbi:MAG: hypothetical protein WCF78_04265 [archaeon]